MNVGSGREKKEQMWVASQPRAPMWMVIKRHMLGPHREASRGTLASVHVCTSIYVCICVSMYVYMCMYVCMHVYMCTRTVHVLVHVCMHVYMCACMCHSSWVAIRRHLSRTWSFLPLRTPVWSLSFFLFFFLESKSLYITLAVLKLTM